MIFDESKIDEHFPLENYRQFQRETIVAIINAINAGKRFVIAECPVGSGKSPIAVTLAKMAEEEGAYYITTTKLLQDQIETDFPFLATLKGRGSYPCSVYTKFESNMVNIIGRKGVQDKQLEQPNCNEGYCKVSGKSSCRLCMGPSIGETTPGLEGVHSHCEYFEKFFLAVNSQTASMNFDNFILHMNFGSKFAPRKILVVDESHNAEEKLLEFLHCTVDSGHLSTAIPEFEEPIEYVAWLEKIQAIEIIKEKLSDAVEQKNVKNVNFYSSLIKKYVLMMHEIKIDPYGWISEFVEDSKLKITKVILKPIFVRKAAQRYLFPHADIIVFLSATILNAKVFASNLGIPEGEYAAISVPSTFPVKNRPIYIDYVGKFTGGKDRMFEWMPKMVKKVEEIARKYPNDRGIIHTHSFGIQKALSESLSKDVASRLIQQHDFGNNKHEMLVEHARRPGSIIIAPAMHEGVDLKDDLSRFQVICKVPYANFHENKQMAARMEADPNFYSFITIMKICQSVGRSIRSKDDYADTYIIDGSFKQLYNRNQASFPKWFSESMVTINDYVQY